MMAQIIPFRTDRRRATPEGKGGPIEGVAKHGVAGPETVSPESTASELAEVFRAIAEARETFIDKVLKGDEGERPNSLVLRELYYGLFRDCLQRGVPGRIVIEVMKACGLSQGLIVSSFEDWESYQAAISDLSSTGGFAANMAGIALARPRT